MKERKVKRKLFRYGHLFCKVRKKMKVIVTDKEIKEVIANVRYYCKEANFKILDYKYDCINLVYLVYLYILFIDKKQSNEQITNLFYSHGFISMGL
jgi:hypothetical protein